MKWDNLPSEIKQIILNFNSSYYASIYIQKIWLGYKTRILIKRYFLLRYLKDFKYYNPSINKFILRSRL